MSRIKGKQRSVTMGELVAAFYEEAHRVSPDDDEAERLARASILHALRWGHVRRRKA